MKTKCKMKALAVIGVLLCCSLCACGGEETGKASDNPVKATESKEKETTEQEAKGNYDVFECIQKINPDNTLAEMNEIIGFEGGDISDGSSSDKVYYWQLTEDTGVRVQFFEQSGNARIDIDFKNKSIANAKNDFSKFDEIKEKLNAGEALTYDEFVEIIGGVEGVLETKTAYDYSYTWVDENGGYLTAQFDAETMECKAASGMF